MSWVDPSHLALDLFGLGRAFFLLPPTSNALAKNSFNPALGRTLSMMLERAIERGAKGEWYEAEKWCVAGEQSQNLEAIYRGVIDIDFAQATARYFHSAVDVGMSHWVNAIGGFGQVAEALSFKLPDHSAAAWLSLAQVHCYHCDAAGALWALQRGLGLVETRTGSTSRILEKLLDAEFVRVAARCKV